MKAANRIGVFNGNMLVVEKGNVIYRSSLGYADSSRTRQLTSETRFDIGSISKEFNAVGIMLLKERGKLKLDDSISKYLGWLPKWAENVKIKHLLQYTSGLPVTKAITDDEYKNNITKLGKLEFSPGTAYVYDNANVYLQKRIIEGITGKSYKEFVENNILKPCKMINAAVDTPGSSPIMAKAFDNNYVESKYIDESSGWVRLTMDDLYKWSTCLHSYNIIHDSSFRELAESFGDGESSLGHTQFENGKLTVHQHQGSNYNFEALLSSNLSDGVTVILLTNNQNFKVNELRDAISAILKDRPYIVPKKSIYLDIREKVLNNFEDGMASYNQLRTLSATYDLANEFEDLVRTGKYLQRRGRFDDAIRLFQLAALFDIKNDDLSYCFELIAETYLKKGGRQMAIIYYRKAVEKDSANKNAKGRLDEILSQK